MKLTIKDNSKYFRHENNNFNNTNERLIHQQGKELLISGLLELGVKDIEMEKYLPNIKQRADIFYERNVMEYQCSIIGESKFTKRVKSYQDSNYNNFWILGGNYLSNSLSKKHLIFLKYNKNWGFYLIMFDAQIAKFRLFYDIHFEGLFNRIVYKSRSFILEDIKELANFKPKLFNKYNIHRVDEYSITRIRRMNDLESQNLKIKFYYEYKKTIEDYLFNKKISAEIPVYKNHKWQRLCGEKPIYLSQPLIKKKS
ncbi:competence protein CoiA family protein [Lactobacillus terrae]|uniref:competence protein CoiA family protein n=1 Tax=Lactobacillus terrae TaxID=2269374 RepID=UPI000C1B6A6E|nr:competence protein CoiA family protein [Lactobacillus terrae]